MSPDFREPSHLPHHRPADDPSDPLALPRQRKGTTPQGHGRYPDYDVLDQARAWDDATREVVRRRVDDPPALRFFDARQAACVTAFCDALLAQDGEPKIPVINAIDEKLHSGKRDGYQYAELPDDGDLWRQLPGGLDHAARARGWISYADAGREVQTSIVEDFASGRLAGELWSRYPQQLIWKVVTRYALEAFYAHPWAWNEIGFGGPAYPRGYARLGINTREPWEGEEARHYDPGHDRTGTA